MVLNQQQALTVLYDLAMTLAGETDPRRLATTMLQRLLAHTGYGCGAILLDLEGEEDGAVSAGIYVTIGARALRGLEGTRGRWPAAQMALGRLTHAEGWFPGGARYPHALQLDLPGVGRVLMLAATTAPEREDQAIALLPPVLAKFGQALRHCLDSEARAQALAVARDDAESANRAKSRFLASVSHELRTPLNAILGYAQLIALDDGVAPPLREQAHGITEAGQQLLAVVSDILDLTRIESGQLQVQTVPIDLSALLAAVVTRHEAVARQRGVQLLTAGHAEPVRVLADDLRLRQVLDNLLSNAIKYNRPEGQVSLLVTVPEAGRVRIAVTDTGRGIDPGLQADLFQPFNRLGAEAGSIQGLGLGLMISRYLVEGMGGRIGLESTPGIGSTFWVDLPAATAVEPVADVPEVARQRILVADDFAPNQAVLRLQLTRLGFDVAVADDGVAALALVRQGGIALVLTDLNMPGMDGFELARAIRADEQAHGGHLPIVAVTAADLPTELPHCRAAGIDDVLAKPIILEELRRLLGRLLAPDAAALAPDLPDVSLDEVAILDVTQLHRVLGDVSRDEWRGVLATFLESAAEGLRRIAAAAGDPGAVAREMHRLKSGARTVGAMRFAAHAALMESAAREGQRVTFGTLRTTLTEVELAFAGLAAPASIPAARPSASSSLVTEVACRSVLVVDDDPVVIRHMSAMLAFGLGIPEVRTAANGRQAADLIAELDGGVDVVICDLEMPEMDGVELIRSLGRSGFHGGVILMSGAEAKVLSTVGTLAGIQGLHLLGEVQKPVGPAQMARLLARFATDVAPAREQRILEEISAEAIRAGIEHGEFEVWYQPKVDAVSLAPIGVESLARWARGPGGAVAPDRFIVAAERHGLIGELSKALVASALAGAARLAAQGAAITVAVNISGRMLGDLSLPDWISAQVQAVGLAPAAIILEITETGLTEDVTRALDVLTRLRLKGFGLSIDDFGIGYSSFEQLGRVPFTELKLDRSFVSRGVHDPAARAILEGSMGMARKLGLTTVAEGVETVEDLELIRTLGCDRVQGYLIARPMPLDELLAWLAARPAAGDGAMAAPLVVA